MKKTQSKVVDKWSYPVAKVEDSDDDEEDSEDEIVENKDEIVEEKEEETPKDIVEETPQIEEDEFVETESEDSGEEEYEINIKPKSKIVKTQTKIVKPKKNEDKNNLNYEDLFNKIIFQQKEIDLLKEQTKISDKKERFMNHINKINALSGRSTKINF